MTVPKTRYWPTLRMGVEHRLRELFTDKAALLASPASHRHPVSALPVTHRVGCHLLRITAPAGLASSTITTTTTPVVGPSRSLMGLVAICFASPPLPASPAWHQYPCRRVGCHLLRITAPAGLAGLAGSGSTIAPAYFFLSSLPLVRPLACLAGFAINTCVNPPGRSWIGCHLLRITPVLASPAPTQHPRRPPFSFLHCP